MWFAAISFVVYENVANRTEGSCVNKIDRLRRKMTFLRFVHRTNLLFAHSILVGGILLSPWMGWEILVGSVFIWLGLMSAGLILSGMREIVEYDYLNELCEIAASDYLDVDERICGAEAYTVGEDHYAECPLCDYRERGFESLADAQTAAARHECQEGAQR